MSAAGTRGAQWTWDLSPRLELHLPSGLHLLPGQILSVSAPLKTPCSEDLPGDLLQAGPQAQEAGSRQKLPDQLTPEKTRWQKASKRPHTTEINFGTIRTQVSHISKSNIPHQT